MPKLKKTIYFTKIKSDLYLTRNLYKIETTEKKML